MPLTLPVIVSIIVLVILAIFFFVGMKKGLLRILFTTFSFVVTIALSAMLTQPLANFLQDSTFVGPSVEKTVTEYVTAKLDDRSGSTSPAEVRSDKDGMSETEDKKTGDKKGGDDADELKLSEQEQSFIDSLALPEFIKKNIRLYNTLEKYRDLGVKTFEDYISTQLTTVIIRAIAFIILAILIYLFLRIIFQILKVIQKLPILKGINRLLGGIIGLAEGLLIIWAVCIFIMIFSGSAFGTSCMSVIRASKVLAFIYDHNLLASAIHMVFGLL